LKEISEYALNLENKSNFIKKRSGTGGGHLILNAER